LEAYVEAIQELLASGKKVILVYPVPEQGWDIPKFTARQLWFGSTLSGGVAVREEVITKRNADVVAAFDAFGKHQNLARVVPQKIFCNTYIKERCASQLGGVPFYYDDDHLSNAGAQLVVSEIMKLIAN
jgi:hypothetical protein